MSPGPPHVTVIDPDAQFTFELHSTNHVPVLGRHTVMSAMPSPLKSPGAGRSPKAPQAIGVNPASSSPVHSPVAGSKKIVRSSGLPLKLRPAEIKGHG